MNKERSYKRRNFFVKKSLQVHFALSSFALLLFSTLGVWAMMNFVFRFYLTEPWVGGEHMFFSRVNAFMCLFILADGIAVFLLSIYFSHFIAGPIYHLEKTLKSIIDGHKVDPIYLRKHDHLQETMDLMNKVIEKISSRH
jgi:hypothetical protein